MGGLELGRSRLRCMLFRPPQLGSASFIHLLHPVPRLVAGRLGGLWGHPDHNRLKTGRPVLTRRDKSNTAISSLSQAIAMLGNKTMNAIWEQRLGDTKKPSPAVSLASVAWEIHFNLFVSIHILGGHGQGHFTPTVMLFSSHPPLLTQISFGSARTHSCDL